MFIYYVICITIYILFLAMYEDLQNVLAQKITELYKRIKEKLCSWNNQKSDSNIHTNIEKVDIHSDLKGKISKSDKMSKNKDLHQQNISEKANDYTKYMQILFFYIQDAILFKVSIQGIKNQAKGLIAKIVSFSPEFVTIIYTKAIHICFSYAEAPATKVLFNMLFGIYFVMIIWLFYLIQKLTSKCLKKRSNILSKVRSCLLKAFFLGMLLSYQNLVSGAFTLVRCVHIANLKVLHIQGDTQCYNWWQYIVMCFIIFFIIPVFIVLSHFPFYIKDKSMSVNTFVVSCLFPAPVILYYVIIKLRRKIHLLHREMLLTENIPIEIVESVKESLDNQVTCNACTDSEGLDIKFIDGGCDDDNKCGPVHSTSCEYHEFSTNVRKSDCSSSITITPVKTMFYSKSEKVILTTLLDHYRKLNVFGVRLTWLCIHKLYRVVLVACNAFITEPIFRICLMTLVLII